MVHGGYCIPEYTVISGAALTVDKPLHCVLAGEHVKDIESQWTGPGNSVVHCGMGTSGSGPFTCNKSSNTNGITLFANPSSSMSYSTRQLYTCAINGQNISIQIESKYIVIFGLKCFKSSNI